MADRPPARIVFFASDLSETAQLRRIRSFASAGHRVSSVSMRKGWALLTDPPDWPDLSLGEIADEQLGRRLRIILGGLGPIWRARRSLADADLLIARNLDMLLLAWLARLMLWQRTPLVYECLDIHGIFTTDGAKGRIARLVERFLLRRAALLVVSSPGFITHYFAPVQRFGGDWLLLENKIWFPGPVIARPAIADNQPVAGRPFVLGWVGSIRCGPSLDLLLATSAQIGPGWRIVVRGVIHDHALPDFHARIAACDNVVYGGPYRWPDGLAEVYDGLDLVWAQDMWQGGANSDWLLPNRLYEAGWFGCPSVAVAGSQTAQRIAQDGIGHVIDNARPEALAALLSAQNEDSLLAARAAVLSRPAETFRLMDSEIDTLVKRVLGPPGNGALAGRA